MLPERNANIPGTGTVMVTMRSYHRISVGKFVFVSTILDLNNDLSNAGQIPFVKLETTVNTLGNTDKFGTPGLVSFGPNGMAVGDNVQIGLSSGNYYVYQSAKTTMSKTNEKWISFVFMYLKQ